ncbi:MULTISPECIES: metalloregulator ArsR/SmtB family transcription factor [Methanobacterium]|jgi:ArsR family transcriptional regulator|uniref:ArsR family transcriptional regulator n=1 Tax=Methanobacterium formicicum TaxID=2162 RepID=A0A090I125_METFO|nr:MULTISPECIES: metalloregulator ArsR/SmtB family transcription factor [Methanobacterium]AIS32830.1 ArsR family transcriptional regulator [Methanobacterium formicicum]KUK73354.1 MAG: Putative transcriptional regulator [Methanobacterium sp. 42_16]MBF4474290.1 winged helix-turn-helix transcriptional regulator [Methanobacterium formicicum]MDD4809568.1 metalloregulator ArsR/SmtB family transcription factor [Methanobacterium formicicum]MDG3546737.1 metalloregulator ArsR/SmtB family transcription f
MKSCEIGGDKPGEDQIKRLKKIMATLPDDEVLYENADTLKALADPTRLKILHLLKHGELCVCEIITAMEKPQPTISHHLNILKKAGYLKWRKEGVWVHYSLSNPKIIDIINKLWG